MASGLLGREILPRNVYRALIEYGGATQEEALKLTVIAFAESGGMSRTKNMKGNSYFVCYERAFNENITDGRVDSIDRGVWQLNSKYQPKATDEIAYTLALAAAYAVKLARESGYDRWTSWAKILKPGVIDEESRQWMRRCDLWRRAIAAQANYLCLEVDVDVFNVAQIL